MSIETLYAMNGISELVIFSILAFLLFTCILQKKRFITAKPLIGLTIVEMALLICQMVEWGLVYFKAVGFLDDIFYLNKIFIWLDYVLFYGVSVAFYRYIVFHLCSAHEIKGKQVNIDPKWVKGLVAWGVLIAVVFGILMSTDWFHFADVNGGEKLNMSAYIVMYIAGYFGVISSVVTLFKYRYTLLKIEFVFLLMYIIGPNFFVIFDLINGTCVTYLLMAMFVFVLYIHIDLRRGDVIFEQTLEIAERDMQLVEKENKLTQQSTQLMLSQIQPHFLYNTLNTISSLCDISPKVAQEATDKFAEYLRENMNSINCTAPIPFSTELSHVEKYVWIEKLRFGKRVNVEYNINTTEFLVPPLTIQPVVENAIKHGICKKPNGGKLIISTYDDEDNWFVSIKDNGVGFDPTVKKEDGRSHVGITNVKDRLTQMVGGTLYIKSKVGKGTHALIKIPKRR